MYASRDIAGGEELLFDYGDRNFVYDDENWVYNASKTFVSSTNGNSKTKKSRNLSKNKSDSYKCNCGKEYSRLKFFDDHRKLCAKSSTSSISKLVKENEEEGVDMDDIFSQFLDSDDSSHYV